MGRLAIVVVVVLAAFAAPSLARATVFKGDVDYWSALTITVKGNTVTSIHGLGGALVCKSSTVVSPVVIDLRTPVPIVQGRFHAEGSGKTPWGTPNSWSLTATISIRRVISGTVTATAQTPTNEVCTHSYRLAAVVAPLSAHSPATSMYMPHNPGSASVRFDYRKGVITHLVAGAALPCPSGTAFAADLDTLSYHLDPVQVNRGHFRVSADVLDGYGVVIHVSMTGTIRGRTAAGAISANRGHDVSSGIESCSMHGSWSAEVPPTAPPPPAVGSSGAFYSVTPLRYGRPGAWTYYIEVKPTSCAGGIVSVRFTISGGASKTVPCGQAVKLGPVAPMRTYRITAVAIRRDGDSVGLAESNIYVPGDDGNWVPIR